MTNTQTDGHSGRITTYDKHTDGHTQWEDHNTHDKHTDERTQ